MWVSLCDPERPLCVFRMVRERPRRVWNFGAWPQGQAAIHSAEEAMLKVEDDIEAMELYTGLRVTSLLSVTQYLCCLGHT